MKKNKAFWQRFLSLPLLFLLVACQGCGIASNGLNVEGRKAYESGSYNEAITKFQTALQRDPRNADGYYNLAAVYHQLGKVNKNQQWTSYAEQMYRKSIELDPGLADSHRGLAVLLIESGRQDYAFDLVRTWQARNPYSAEPLIELSRLYQEYGDRQQATKYLADALAVDSTNFRALKAMGHIRELDGQYQLALDNYVRAYNANNMQPDVANKIAQLQGQIRSAGVPQTSGPQRLGNASQFVPR